MSWRLPDLEMVQLRAELVSRTRRFFSRRNVREVETPLSYPFVPTDPSLDCFVATRGDASAGEPEGWLQPSPEFAMKQMLGQGSGCIYQICKAFRAGESGRLHRPEFTLLEWYRVGMDYRVLADEVLALLEELLPSVEFEKMSYASAFSRWAGVDPLLTTSADLVARLRRSGQEFDFKLDDLARPNLLDLLMSTVVEPNLPDSGVVLFDYPLDQSTLARSNPSHPNLAERFEVYVNGVELANGYSELTDADEQRERFEAENSRRRQLGKPERRIDEALLAALSRGLPECAGVAIGFDRLVMLAAGRSTLAGV